MARLDIGNSDFKDIILNQRYYIDKTLLIRDVLNGSKVTLLPRPRRFGKTLNMTMLRYFLKKQPRVMPDCSVD
jgi:ethanolamine utilization cobalamin adenosyltransferase